MRKDESDCVHVRLDKKSTKKLRRISRKTKRSLTVETNEAVSQYKPRMVKFTDNGK